MLFIDKLVVFELTEHNLSPTSIFFAIAVQMFFGYFYSFSKANHAWHVFCARP